MCDHHRDLARRIEALAQEAGCRGDTETRDLCRAALRGGPGALDDCAELLEQAVEKARAKCELCGCEGVESNWPGGDPRNAWAESEVILCANADGDLVCDDCSEI